MFVTGVDLVPSPLQPYNSPKTCDYGASFMVSFKPCLPGGAKNWLPCSRKGEKANTHKLCNPSIGSDKKASKHPTARVLGLQTKTSNAAVKVKPKQTKTFLPQQPPQKENRHPPSHPTFLHMDSCSPPQQKNTRHPPVFLSSPPPNKKKQMPSPPPVFLSKPARQAAQVEVQKLLGVADRPQLSHSVSRQSLRVGEDRIPDESAQKRFECSKLNLGQGHGPPLWHPDHSPKSLEGPWPSH